MGDQVFCKNCRHLDDSWGHACDATTHLDPIHGEVSDRVDPRSRNAGMDCDLFKATAWSRLLRMFCGNGAKSDAQ